LEEINNQKGEAIFQLFISKSELDKHEWEDVLKCIKLFHSKTNPSYSVIGFNQKCSKVVTPLLMLCVPWHCFVMCALALFRESL